MLGQFKRDITSFALKWFAQSLCAFRQIRDQNSVRSDVCDPTISDRRCGVFFTFIARCGTTCRPFARALLLGARTRSLRASEREKVELRSACGKMVMHPSSWFLAALSAVLLATVLADGELAGGDQCTMRTGLNCNGNDLPNGILNLKDAAACCQACQKRKGCKAFNFEGADTRCLLKSNCGGAQVAPNSTFGGVTNGPIPDAIDCKDGHTGPAPTPYTRPLPENRPLEKDRTFISPELEKQLSLLVHNKTWHDPELATLLWNCLPNTLDTTIWEAPNSSNPDATTFISTGDIAGED